MVTVFILLGFGCLAMILFLIARDKYTSIKAIILKTLTSMFFIATGFGALVVLVYRHQPVTLNQIGPALFILGGLIAGMVGDITLDLKIYFKTLNMKVGLDKKARDSMMWTGLIAFAIGHLFYLASLLTKTEHNINLLWSAIIGVVLIGIVLIVSTKVLGFKYGKFIVPCGIYGALLATFVVFSLFIMIEKMSVESLVTFIGSLLFIISDLVLSMTYFSSEEKYEKEGFLNPESKFMITVNHVTYYSAQFLIAVSILFIL